MKKQVEEIAALEQSISSLFAQRSLPFLNRQLTDDWDKLFLMQHYGVPTRLLDWTENPFVGLYFAFSGPSEPESDAVLWMCDAEAWNKSALHAFTFTGGVLDQSMDEARYFAPGKPISQMPNAPVMLYGQHNSARIVAQRGVFALFGQSLDGMDTLAADAAFGDGVLTRVVLKKAKIKTLRESLFRKGVSESVVFPDLDGLAKEIRRKLEF